MPEVRLSAEPRTEFGKGSARRTRRAGKIPAVIYGHGADPRHISLQAREFVQALKHGGMNVLLTVTSMVPTSSSSRRRSSATRSRASSSTSTCSKYVVARR